MNVQEKGTTGELYRGKDAWASNAWTEQTVVNDAPPAYWKHAEVLYYTWCFCFILSQPKTEAIFSQCQMFYPLIHQPLSLYIPAWYRLGSAHLCPTSPAHGADEGHVGQHMPTSWGQWAQASIHILDLHHARLSACFHLAMGKWASSPSH